MIFHEFSLSLQILNNKLASGSEINHAGFGAKKKSKNAAVYKI